MSNVGEFSRKLENFVENSQEFLAYTISQNNILEQKVTICNFATTTGVSTVESQLSTNDNKHTAGATN